MRRRRFFGGSRSLELLELRAGGELAFRVERLLGLLGGHLPGRVGRFKLLGLFSRNFLGIGRERLLELFRWHLSKIVGCGQLRFLRRGNGVELDRSVCVEHLPALLGGLLLFDCGRIDMRGLRGGEFRVVANHRFRGVELCGLRLRPVRGGDWLFGLLGLRGGPVPNQCGRDGLCELPRGFVRVRDGGEQRECVFQLRRGPVPAGCGGERLRKLRGGAIWERAWPDVGFKRLRAL